MKKVLTAIVLLFAICLGCFAFAGCNTAKAANDFVIPEGGFDVNTPITIKFSHTMGSNLRDVLDRYIVEFNKIYPNIHINLANYGDADGLYGSLSMVNSNTDLVLCLEDNAVRLQEKLDNLVNLESLIYSEAVVIRGDYSTEKLGLTAQQKDALYTVCLESCRLTEREDVYSLPFYQLPEVMYYNKTYFEANDLQVPQSWDEVWETAVRIQAAEDVLRRRNSELPHPWFPYGEPYMSPLF